MLTLGIETSCDETSIALVEDGRDVRVNLISSQTDLHERFGGVVPEVAARRHVEMLNPMLDEAMSRAGAALHDVGLLAVTNRPGLMGALLAGVAAAKALALATGLPLVGVHHLEAHIYANFIGRPELAPPLLALVVSGGHTDLVLMRGHGDYQILGRTRDDAAGEAFDKVGRAMGLAFPGGPEIDRLARSGDPKAFGFPRADLGRSLDFSFSGLKTSLLRFLAQTPNARPADVAASFQEAVVDALAETTRRAARAQGLRTVVLAGGVAANSRLKALMSEVAADEGWDLSVPPPILCTDNAAMIAVAGYHQFVRCGQDGLDLETYASQRLDAVRA